MKKRVEAIVEIVKEKLGEGYDVRSSKVLKQGGVERIGVTVRTLDSNIAPNIYIDFEENEKYSDEEIAEHVIQAYKSHNVKNTEDLGFDLSKFMDWEGTRGQLRYKLLNIESNMEYLKDKIWTKYLGMAAVVYVVIHVDQFECSSITIGKKISEVWGKTENEIIAEAMKNTIKSADTDVMIRSLRSILNEMHNKEVSEELGNIGTDVSMLVVTNEKKYLGAGFVFIDSVLKKIQDILDDDFYIIPSSIHECLVVKKSDNDGVDHIKRMAYEVNKYELEPEEVLSYDVFLYERAAGRVEIV